MSLKSWLDRRLKDDVQAEQINANDSRAHSNAYHRFFSGYTEVKKVKRGGCGYTIDRVYTGRYYQRAMGRRKSLFLKLLYAGMIVAAVLLFFSAAAAQVQTNGVWYVVLWEALSIASIVWMCTGIGNSILSPEKMTVYEYNSSSGRIRKASLCASAALGMTVLASVLWLVLHAGQMNVFDEMIACILKLSVSTVLVFALNRLESAVKYEETANEMSGKVNGVEIK